MAHKTLVNGTAYEISGGRALVNGTGYDIKSGKTLVGGTAYEVGFVNTMAITLLGDYTEDSSNGYKGSNSIKHNGNLYYSGDTIEANAGDTIEFYTAYDQYYGIIYLNGTDVSRYIGQYTYTVVSDATITLEMFIEKVYDSNGKSQGEAKLFNAYIVDANG